MTDVPDSYPMPSYSLPSLSLENRLADLDELKDYLKLRGIEAHNTRIDRYQKYMRLLTTNPAMDFEEARVFRNVNDERFKSSLDWYLYILREVDELTFIMKGLKKHLPKGATEKLQKIVSGADFAALDKNTESRNTQFELRIASYFCQAGFEVDLSTDTDIVATKEKHVFFIECKRIATERQLEENLLKAKQQLKSRMPKSRIFNNKYIGIIAVDVTKVAYTHNGLTLGLTNEHARDVMQRDLKAIELKALRFDFFSKKPPIILSWFQIHMPGILTYPPQPFTRFSSLISPNAAIEFKWRRAITMVCKTIEVASSPDARELPAAKLNQSITLPVGSTFWSNSEVLEAILKKATNPEESPVFEDENQIRSDEEVVGITIKDESFTFCSSEVAFLLNTIPTEKRVSFADQLLKNDNAQSLAELLCMLLLRKHPFHQSLFVTEEGPSG